MTTQQVTIQPGSIKHKILEAILELGSAATGAAIRRRHPSNEHLVNVSIEQLEAAGVIEITSEGPYKLTDITKRSIRGQSIEGAIVAIAQTRRAQVQRPVAAPPEPPAPPPPARPQRRAPDTPAAAQPDPIETAASPSSPEPEEPAVAKLINCNKCEAEKATADFYTSNGKLVQPCKACILKRQKQLREGKGKPSERPGKRAAKSQVTVRSSKETMKPVAGGELVIPASGAIRCQRAGDGYEISQGNDRVCCSAEQLQALRDWASSQLKARS